MFQGGTKKDNTTGDVVGNYTYTNTDKNTYWNANYNASNKTYSMKKNMWAGEMEKKGKYQEGRKEEVFAVSKYLWFALDSWGKNNANSNMTQCSTAQQCGNDKRSAKSMCCAAISMQNKTSGN